MSRARWSMSPFEITALLWLHTRPGWPEQFTVASKGLVRATVDMLVHAGLAEWKNVRVPGSNAETPTLLITRKGRFYVTDGLGAVPLPVVTQQYAIPWGKDD